MNGQKVKEVAKSVMGFAIFMAGFGGLLYGMMWSGNLYRESYPSVSVAFRCEVDEVEATREQVRAIVTDESAVGTLLKYRDGSVRMITHVYPQYDDGFALLSEEKNGRSKGLASSGLASSINRSKLCFISRIIKKSDEDYSQKRSSYFKSMGEVDPLLK